MKDEKKKKNEEVRFDLIFMNEERIENNKMKNIKGGCNGCPVIADEIPPQFHNHTMP